ncbi:MAG: carboxypeptidase-like regulatory domain-containing protein, partial [Tannerella sp.]|nr:carboxypeptidase-like regulatory domain-containing protein [Tannerella sp.]
MTKLNFPIGNRKRFLFFILFLLIVWNCMTPVAGQNNIILRGKVVDKLNNEPVIGVAVVLKGDKTNSGTATDADGLFSLNVSSLPATIVVSYIGYRPQEID